MVIVGFLTAAEHHTNPPIRNPQKKAAGRSVGRAQREEA
jgi:hypothetical protein